MKEKYEISLWEDYLVDASGSVPAHYEERQIAVIGSNTMTSLCRAYEPKLSQNINGTCTFTFKMYYVYNELGKEYKNPFLSYLVNERRVKVFWKDEWYDFVIKDCSEDSSSKSITYTCKDLFINELSKTGFNLEFDTELENNQGTIEELGAKILEGTDWQLDTSNSEIVFQESEEAVYQTMLDNAFTAVGVDRATGADVNVSVASGTQILVFYSTVSEQSTFFQFWYVPGGSYVTDGSSMLVLNGQCVSIDGCTWVQSGSNYIVRKGVQNVCTIPVNAAVSTNFRAKRLVRSQLQVVDPLTDKYCSVYVKDNTEYYSFFETEYTDVVMVSNYITNSKNFSGTTGWSGPSLAFTLYPPYVEGYAYDGKGYLSLGAGNSYYNSGIKDFRSYIKSGFSKGEKYVFRIKAMTDSGGLTGTYCTTTDMKARPFIGTYTYDATTQKHTHTGSNYFSYGNPTAVGDWIEFELTCVASASYEGLLDLGLFIDNNASGAVKLWIEDIQFFKYATGTPVIQTDYDSAATYVEDDTLLYDGTYYRCIRDTVGNAPTNTTYWTSLGTSEPTSVRINPGSFSAQSYANEIWRLYVAHQNLTDSKDLAYVYSGSEVGLKAYLSENSIVPKYGANGKYEKIRSITGKQSNRYNLLQSLAETFEVWIKFNISHDSTGRMIYVDGKPQKFISFVNEVGGRNGLTFKYGIDLKAISRTINSDAITTKVIVSANNNQYGKDGFCTIARAKDNYPKTSFILNFDYFISQGLLSRSQILNDLYSSDSQYIGYYYYLHIYNSAYDNLMQELIEKKNEIEKLKAKKIVLDSQIAETQEKITKVEDDLAHYAGYSCFCEAEVKAYLDGRGSVDTVAHSAWAVRMSLINAVKQYSAQKANIDKSIAALQARITTIESQMDYYIGLINDLDARFYAKYSRFIQEGSWTSDIYYDDDLYYYDALDTSYTSSRPQISYNISVIRISSIEEFKNKVFHLGDISYVEDTEFFGYEEDGVTPYREEVVISEIISNFDAPQNDEIKVQNYKTQFEDLFQRITATTQTLQYTTGAYNNTVNNFTTTGELKDDVLQRSLEANNNLTLASDNDSVVITKEGIVVTDPNNPAKMIRITPSGVQLTTDKGAHWTSAITANGIQPQALTAGPLATDKVNITDGEYPTFKWDKWGLSAYSYEEDAAHGNKITRIKDGTFVRFDRYGLYGVDDETLPSDWHATSDTEIVEKAQFGFIWGKFFMKSSSGDGSVQISSDNDIQVLEGDGPNPERIKIGRLDDGNGNTYYGIRISDAQGAVLETGNDGSLRLVGILTVTNGTDVVQIGDIGNDEVINANNGNFVVYSDGSVVANDITINGGSISAVDVTNVTLDGGSWDTV